MRSSLASTVQLQLWLWRRYAPGVRECTPLSSSHGKSSFLATDVIGGCTPRVDVANGHDGAARRDDGERGGLDQRRRDCSSERAAIRPGPSSFTCPCFLATHRPPRPEHDAPCALFAVWARGNSGGDGGYGAGQERADGLGRWNRGGVPGCGAAWRTAAVVRPPNPHPSYAHPLHSPPVLAWELPHLPCGCGRLARHAAQPGC
jgi:hypothetical protein